MKKLDTLPDDAFIFGAFFVIANRIDTLLERAFKKYDITTKQWFLAIVLDNILDSPPTIKEVSYEMGTSHQNIKQVALKLQEKGLLKLEKDTKDKRIIRLKLTNKSRSFLDSMTKDGELFRTDLYQNIPKTYLSITRKTLAIILNNINTIEEKGE